jgi:hypothetical protein
MKALSKTFVLLLAAFGLASCGGGGGGSQGAFQPTPSDTISINASSTSITTNGFITLTVTVKKHDGTIENDGVQVTASVTPVTMGSVSGSAGSSGATATNTLAGGNTTFIFTSGNQTGTATVTMSLAAGTNGSPTATSSSIPITVTAGSSQDPRLQFSENNASLPLNPFDFAAQQATPFPGNFPGSPYVSEIVVTWRHTGGSLVSDGNLNVSISPSTVALFSTDAEDLTTFHALKPSGSVPVTGGTASIFVHSGNVPGTATLSVTATDPESGQTISSQLQITVAGSGSTLPSSVTVASTGTAYLSQSTLVTFKVTDGSNALIADPSGFDNVQVQVAGPANSDVVLRGVNAAGQSVSGNIINIATHNGIAAVTVQAGTQQGPVQIKATADRGDGNVDNDIQDPVSATATVVVSDGKLFSLKITNPAVSPNLLPVTGTASSSGTPTPVYTVPVTVLATDRQGSPVLAGTVIQFGLIDAPVFGFPDQGSGTFELSGSDGNPQEGGTLFGAPGGAFRTAGGGAGPGDAIVLFGKETSGDADLESARSVQRIDSQTTLHVVTPFNLNDITGVSVDTGNNIPYVIGRATAGNIDKSAVTGVDDGGAPNGVASVNMRYPQSRIGQSVVVFAQGIGTAQTTGGSKTVGDASRMRYLGVGPANLFAEPTTIFGNTTANVTVCLEDGAGSPIPGVTITFQFANLGTATGTADGKPSGTLIHPTGADGCTVTPVVTSGVLPGSDSQIIFSFNELTAPVNITVGSAVLTASPSHYPSSANGTVSDEQAIKLTLKDGLGNLVPNATITGTCSASGNGIGGPATISLDASQYITGIGSTGSPLGIANAVITTLNFCVESGTAPSGLCTFTYAQGAVNATATVTVSGTNTNGSSPGCGP